MCGCIAWCSSGWELPLQPSIVVSLLCHVQPISLGGLPKGKHRRSGSGREERMQRRGRLQGKTGRSGGRANCGQTVMYEIRINYINTEYI